MNANSIAGKLLDAVEFPYPSPLPVSNAMEPFQPSLGPFPAGKESVALESRAFFKDHLLRNFSQPPEVFTNHRDDKSSKSPITLLSNASSSPLTPSKHSSMTDGLSSPATSLMSTSNNVAWKPQPSELLLPRSKTDLIFSSPISHASSSPDPLMIKPLQKKVGNDSAHRKNVSSSSVTVVVEILVSPSKNRPGKALVSNAFVSDKRAHTASKYEGGWARPTKNTKHGPFSDLTSEVDYDGQAESSNTEMEVVAAPVMVNSKQTRKINENDKANVVQRVHIKQTEALSNTHVNETNSNVDKILLEKLTNYLQEILDADDSIASATHMDFESGADDDNALRHFVVSGSDGRGALLQPNSIRKLTKMISTISSNSSGRRALERATVQGSEIDNTKYDRKHAKQESGLLEQLVDILRVLERSINEAETVRIIPGNVNRQKPQKESKISPKKRAANGREKSNDSSPLNVVSSSALKPRRTSRSATPIETYMSRRYEGDTEEEEEEEESDVNKEEHVIEKEKDGERGSSAYSSPTQALQPRKGKHMSTTKGQKGAKKRQATSMNTESPYQWTDELLDELVENLGTLTSAFLAIEACISILTAGSLPKKVRYSFLLQCGRISVDTSDSFIPKIC